METILCRDADAWVLLRRDHPTVAWYMVRREAAARLREIVEAALDIDPLTHPLTFSERERDVVVVNIANVPDEIPHVAPTVQVTILSPEGRLQDSTDRWATLYRSPREVSVWSHGIRGVFRPKTLREEITRFFGFDDEKLWKSFVGGKHGIAKALHQRELWVRPGWRARELASSDFPAFRPGPVVGTEEQAKRFAKLPQTRSKVRRAKQAANLERFRREAAERAVLREQGQER
jgi:hypothetical protein